MARKYDFTRFVTGTVINVKTVNDNLELVNDTMFIDSIVTEEEAKATAKKRYGKCIIESVNYTACMYGLTTADVVAHGAMLNPYTRQPWNGESEEERKRINSEYLAEQMAKKNG